MPLRRVLGILAGLGLFLSPVAFYRGEGTQAAARMRPVAAPQAAALFAAAPIAASGSDGMRAVRARSGPLVIATDRARLNVRDRPNGRVTMVPARNPWEQPLSFPVIGRKVDPRGREWLRVLLGVRPNGASGWVPTDRVRGSAANDRIVVDLSARTLRRWHDGRLLDRFPVAVGAASSPTPAGRFFVWARLDASATGPYGTFVLGLSGFPGQTSGAQGDARLAIHGTDDPGDLGQAVSHGCVRVLNDQLLQLRDVAMGTLVTIRA